MIWKKKQFWGAVLAVALLAYCLKDIRLADLEALAGRAGYWFFLPAVICTFLFVILRGLRWRLMVAQQKQVGVVRAVTLFAAGQILNTLMPALTGQVGRMFLFARKEGLRKTFVFSTMVLEVLFDAVSLIVFLLLTSLAFAFPEEYRLLGIILSVVTVLVLIILYMALHFQLRIDEFGRRHIRERWPGAYITVKKFLRSFIKGIELLRSSQHLLGTMGLSLASWALHLLVIYFLFRAFGFQLPLASAAAVMIINTLVLLIPITPGHTGTFEIAVSTTLIAFSIGRSDAVLCALALHLLDLLPIFLMGFSFFHVERVSLRELRRRHQDEHFLDHVSEEGVLVEKEERV
ncbi:MAG TPA: lysylphosphatidylglycerol synthase transmembrane domain-containing protein [Candidatus Deferrimicrobium sp.]|nr:lysylphosphatidylglycerol synthase transmembrane domain-containing protein [Candidatus Deferrimicrobium sp.]